MTTDIIREDVSEQEIQDSFVSTASQPLLTYNYLVLLSAQRQSPNEQSTEDGINMAWMTLDSTTGATLDSTEVYIYKDYGLQQALQKVFHSIPCHQAYLFVIL
jgi:hypothetical protein